jgi:hypothetical protein
MTVKNNFKKQRKDTKKRKQRDTKRTAIKTAGTFKEAAKKKKQDKNKYSPEFIRQYVAEHGIERAVHDLKLKGDDSHFTNQDIMRFIHDIIPSMIHPHAAIEILETLESEGKVTISDEFRELIKSYDILVREVNWDINNIITFIVLPDTPTGDTVTDIANLKSVAVSFNSSVKKEYKILFWY